VIVKKNPPASVESHLIRKREATTFKVLKTITKQEKQMFTMENLETGNPLIDQQHRQLISVVNDLLSTCKQVRIEQLEPTLAFLRYYAAKHCFDEEVLQIQYSYPDYAAHRACHDEIKITIRNFVVGLKENGPGENFTDGVACIGGWFINHVLTEDLKLAHHIQRETKIALSA
jgi:hemerythrin